MVDAAKDEAAVVAGRAKEETSKLVDEARRTLRTQSEQQTGRAASGARDLARQLEDLASGRGGTDGPVAGFAHDAASRINALADRLESNGIDGITGDVKQFARRRPGTFLAGAFALGIAAGRVFRNADTSALTQAARPDSQNDGGNGDGMTHRTAPGAEYGEGMLGADALGQSLPSTGQTATAGQTHTASNLTSNQNQEDTSWPTPPKP